MSAPQLTRSLFKAMLRSSKQLDLLVPAASFSHELASFVMPEGIPISLKSRSFTATLRSAFKASALAPELAGELQNVALLNLSKANSRIAAMTAAPAAELAAAAEEGKALTAPLYATGQVLKHRLFGYKGVICGMDALCQASPAWVSATGADRLPHGTQQPFYHVLVHAGDRPGAQVSYCAQDNICLLSDLELAAGDAEEEAAVAVDEDSEEDQAADGGEGALQQMEELAASVEASFPSSAAANPLTALDRFVLHPLLPRYFDSFNAKLGAFIPNEAHRPGADNTTSSGSDSSEDSDESSNRSKPNVHEE